MNDAGWQARVRAAAAGDAAAQTALVDEFYDPVQRLVHQRLQLDFRRRHPWILPLFSTRDVVHDVLVDAIRRLDCTDFPEPGAFAAYLATVVRHHLLDLVRFHEAERRDARRNRTEDPGQTSAGERTPGAEPSPELSAALRERAALLRAAMAELGQRQATLLELRMVEEQSFPEIARALGYASEDTARQAFLDAQARLLLKLRTRGLRPEP
ncbi:MAG: sigma-70 family RNA polymerase sigma factor [Planctomycetes bacterium]|nr:sigma-70 family RNA polymerase sigma factor [Planctomycetota bacterium]